MPRTIIVVAAVFLLFAQPSFASDHEQLTSFTQLMSALESGVEVRVVIHYVR